MYSVNTGLLTTICIILECIFWAAMQSNETYLVFFFATPTLLLNALLATLNARQELRETLYSHADLVTIPLSGLARSSCTSGAPEGSVLDIHQTRIVPRDLKFTTSEQVV